MIYYDLFVDFYCLYGVVYGGWWRYFIALHDMESGKEDEEKTRSYFIL